MESRATAYRMEENDLGCAFVEVVDGIQGMILNMPAECGHAAADIEPWHHHSCDQLVPNDVPQH